MVSFFKVPFLNGIHFAFATSTVRAWLVGNLELVSGAGTQVRFHLVTNRLINQPRHVAKKISRKKCNTDRNRPQKEPFLVRVCGSDVECCCAVFWFNFCYVEFSIQTFNFADAIVAMWVGEVH